MLPGTGTMLCTRFLLCTSNLLRHVVSHRKQAMTNKRPATIVPAFLHVAKPDAVRR